MHDGVVRMGRHDRPVQLFRLGETAADMMVGRLVHGSLKVERRGGSSRTRGEPWSGAC